METDRQTDTHRHTQPDADDHKTDNADVFRQTSTTPAHSRREKDRETGSK